MKQRIHILFRSIFLLLLGPLCINASQVEVNRLPTPALFDLSKLNEIKQKGYEDTVIKAYLSSVDRLLQRKTHTVMDKEHSFSPNPHDYCSIAPYSWPDEKNPDSPYITKDGIINPERDYYDKPSLTAFALALKHFSIAYYITEEMKYYEAFEELLKAWFVNPQTYMEPNMEYAQVVKGRNGNKGQYYGLVDMLEFTNVIESILLVNCVKEVDRNLLIALQEWFVSFLEWLFHSRQWMLLSETNNNIITGSYVVIVEMASFVGDNKTTKRITREFSKNIIKKQIDKEGRQPAELKRTIGFGYSVNNLSYIVDFCLIMEQAGHHFYKKNQQVIESAFEYLLQFVGNHESFPYKQIQDWDSYEAKLVRYLEKLKRMKSKGERKFEYVSDIVEKTKSVMDYVY